MIKYEVIASISLRSLFSQKKSQKVSCTSMRPDGTENVIYQDEFNFEHLSILVTL
ncbi:MAG: hypothetical protein L3J07_03365 [Candidatus Magasanikbacteria bacterium]|nr:hypothetical protein [Candidatus Magasanikbacteria bacterium]